MKKIIPVIVIIMIIGIGVYTYLTGGKVQLTGNGISVSKTITSKSETFTGDLKAAVAKGTPFKCTFKTNQGTEGVGYIKNKQYFGDLVVNGKTGNILMLGNCFWTWDKTTKMGAKMCLDGDIWASQDSDNTKAAGDYVCTSDESILDEMFVPPTDVKFIDADSGQE